MSQGQRMKIAILGTRGIPARYGGFETLADQLSQKLVQRGHSVIVYCRKPFTHAADVYDPRIRRVILPTITSKHFDTLFHTFISVWHVMFSDAEVILICNVASSPFAWIPRLFGKPTALNVDGLDRKRRKWNLLGQWFLHWCELLSPFTPSRVVTDARAVQDYYRKRYRMESVMIAYGAEPAAVGDHFQQFDLARKQYILYVARLEPENNPELVIRAYHSMQTDWPLVVVGGNAYRPSYVQQLQAVADGRVRFLGPVYGDSYWALQRNAGLFVFAGEIGGVHPALVEAMAAGNAILYLDTPANRETVCGCGVAFQAAENDLSEKMARLLQSPAETTALAKCAQEVAEKNYSWEKVTDSYEHLFREMLTAGK
jgi:glycosyltransferase involved in cell wall biosynthesis